MSNLSPEARAAQESARQKSGKFGEQNKADPGQLNLGVDRPAPLPKLHLSASNRNANEMARLVAEGRWSLDASYQRPGVWSKGQKQALIRSMIQGVPIPGVVVNQRADSAESLTSTGVHQYVVDGKQRLTALKEWREGTLKVPAHWFETEDLKPGFGPDDEVGRDDLNPAYRNHSDFSWTMPCSEGRVPDERGEAELYLLLNGGGTAHTSEDMDRAIQVLNAKQDQG